MVGTVNLLEGDPKVFRIWQIAPQLGSLLEAGNLQPVVDAVLPLTRATEAYTGEVRQRRGCGKLVVAVAAQEGA